MKLLILRINSIDCHVLIISATEIFTKEFKNVFHLTLLVMGFFYYFVTSCNSSELKFFKLLGVWVVESTYVTKFTVRWEQQNSLAQSNKASKISPPPITNTVKYNL